MSVADIIREFVGYLEQVIGYVRDFFNSLFGSNNGGEDA